MRSAFMCTLLVGCGVAAMAGAAKGEIIHFTNPGPGKSGHYDWRWPGFFVRSWLDITRGPADQTGTQNGSSIAQTRPALGHPEEANVIFGSAQAAILGDAVHGQYTRAFEVGDPLFGPDFDMISTLYYWNSTDPDAIPPWGASLFPEGSRRYIGVLTTDGRYGWIEVERAGGNLTAYSWAHETVAGEPILAGQVPLPGAAALLGIASVLRLHRRRRSAIKPPVAQR